MTNPHDIIIKPVVTEQSMTEMGNKTYTFVVAKSANKNEIKKAVGKTASFKKAVVKLAADSKDIEFFTGM
ncbi:MAG: 50S ribosomal protein L23 [Peptostreptococcus sp.]|nr:50S ribosomal protein L23 [Peptostreptococcus sp.]